MKLKSEFFINSKADIENQEKNIWLHNYILTKNHDEILKFLRHAAETVQDGKAQRAYDESINRVKSELVLEGAEAPQLALIAMGKEGGLKQICPQPKSISTLGALTVIILALDFLMFLFLVIYEGASPVVVVIAIILAIAGTTGGLAVSQLMEEYFLKRYDAYFDSYRPRLGLKLIWFTVSILLFGCVIYLRTFRDGYFHYVDALLPTALYLLTTLFFGGYKALKREIEICTDKMFDCQWAYQTEQLKKRISEKVYEQYFMSVFEGTCKKAEEILKEEGTGGKNV